MLLRSRLRCVLKVVLRFLFCLPTTSKIEQAAFTQYIVDGYLQKHLRKLVREYREAFVFQLMDTHNFG